MLALTLASFAGRGCRLRMKGGHRTPPSGSLDRVGGDHLFVAAVAQLRRQPEPGHLTVGTFGGEFQRLQMLRCRAIARRHEYAHREGARAGQHRLRGDRWQGCPAIVSLPARSM